MAGKLKDYEDTDELNNPSSEVYRREHGLDGSHDAIPGYDRARDGLDSHPGFSDDQSKNIDAARDRENQFNYSRSEQDGISKPRQPIKATLKGLLNKKSATGGIIGGIAAIFFGLGVMVSPSLAIVHLKEILTEDLNDQLTAMDIRSQVYMKAKFKDLGKSGSVCTLVKFRCELKGMTERQIKNFEKAGIKVELFEDDSGGFGRSAVKSLTFTDSLGNEQKVSDPSKFNRLIGDKSIRNQLRRAYNPKFYGFSDKVGLTRLNLHGGKVPIKGTDKATLDSEFDEAVRRPPGSVSTKTTTSENEDDKAKVDSSNAESQSVADNISKSTGGVKGVFKSAASGSVRGLQITGALTSACTVRAAGKAVAAAAKIQRAAQVAAAAVFIFKVADTIKAGKATPELAEYTGNRLGSTDTDRTIVSEDSKLGSDGKPEEIDNPDYGKSAYDAQAVKAGMYNDAPQLSARSASYAVGGGLVGSLSSVMNKADNMLGGKKAADDSCEVLTNPWFQGGSFVIGLAAGVVSLGTFTAISAGASIAISMAMPILESYLADMVAGKVVSSSTNGVDLGNAIFSGAGVLMGGMAMARGMKPANKSDLQAYTAHVRSVESEYIAMETEEAKDTPLDVMNQYSFLGQAARSFLPVSRQTGSVSIASLGAIYSTSAQSFIPKAAAVGDFNPKRFEQCPDDAYATIGIDADVMCNVRYVLSDEELGMNVEEVYAYMDENGLVTEDGEPQGDYADWVKQCTERESGWGETNSENGEEDGAVCLQTDKRTSIFRVYTMDRSIGDGMDNGTADVNQGSAEAGAGSKFRIASYNQPARGDSNVAAKAIIDNDFDIVGMQEIVRDNYANLKNKLGENYSVFPDVAKNVPATGCATDQSIFYNKNKFRLVSSETFGFPRYEHYRATDCGNGESKKQGEANAPVILLEDTRPEYAEQQFYVINIHNVANVQSAKEPSKNRYLAAQIFINKIKQLKQSNPDIPIFMTGDFNEGHIVRAAGMGNVTYNYQEPASYKYLFYCMAMDSKLLLAVNKPNTPCRQEKARKTPVDFIYYSPEVTVDKDGSFKDQSTNDAPHEVPWADVTIPGAAGVGSLNIATFNILHDGPDPGERNWAERLPKSMGVLNSNKISVAGLQEVRPPQGRQIMKDYGSKFGIFPEDFDSAGGGFSPNPIIWDKSMYKGTLKKRINIRYDDNKMVDHAILVKLRDSTGNEFYVLNTHDPANARPGSNKLNARSRLENTRDYVNLLASLRSEGKPLFLVGDFNAAYKAGGGQPPYQNDPKNLAYCVVSRSGFMKNVWDVYEKKSFQCPRAKTPPGAIDHIYVGNVSGVSKVWTSPSAKNGSDHPTVMATVTLPWGSESGGASKNYKEPSYKASGVKVDEPGGRCTGGFTVGAQSLSADIKKKWSSIKTIGGYACRANTADPSSLSVHAVGRALDIMVDGTKPAGLKTGNEIKNYLINNSKALGVQRVIWNRHIWSANQDGWRDYSGPSPHIDHVHAEINLEASKKPRLAG